MKIEGSGSASGSGSRQRHGSADPDPHQNVMDPEHYLKGLETKKMGSTETFEKKNNSIKESEFLRDIKAPGSIEKSWSNIKRNVTRIRINFPDMV